VFTEAAYSARRHRKIATTRVLVTGAAGSIGETVVPLLRERPMTEVFATDLDGSDRHLDVTDGAAVKQLVTMVRPTHILHLAGAKHAPEGELDPGLTFRVNTVGTENILAHRGRAKVVLASTCKACDPETVYGASKLIAERMVLNSGGVVLRFFNVRETSGNVFRLWEQIPTWKPIPYTDCWRYFISKQDAVNLTVAGLKFPSGRYTVDPGAAQHMRDVADILYPGRIFVRVPARRGDRQTEPFKAAAESSERVPGTPFLKITGPHDP
jgi:FlaA1/EpsC-like NDP-sugar epimerase